MTVTRGRMARALSIAFCILLGSSLIMVNLLGFECVTRSLKDQCDRVPFRCSSVCLSVFLFFCCALRFVGSLPACRLDRLCSSSFPGCRLALPFCFAVWSFRFH